MAKPDAAGLVSSGEDPADFGDLKFGKFWTIGPDGCAYEPSEPDKSMGTARIVSVKPNRVVLNSDGDEPGQP